VAGWAETAQHDPTCTGHQVLNFKAAVWTDGDPQVLRPLPGDPR